MNSLIQHSNTIIRMYKNNINSGFIKKYSIDEILNCCERIEKSSIDIGCFKDNELFQKALIEDAKFVKYLKAATYFKYDIDAFEDLLGTIIKHGEKMSNYSFKDIFKVLKNTQLNHNAYYIFLKDFIKEDYFTRKLITENLNYFYMQDVINFETLLENEKNLVKSNYISNYNLMPRHIIKEIYTYLAQNEELRSLIKFLTSKKLYIPLSHKSYEILNKNPKETEELIKDILDMINNDDIVYKMLLNWLQNDCSIYDLKIIKDKLNKNDNLKLDEIFSNKASYINFIYGTMLKKFPLNDIYGSKEEILIYAIRENKKSFLKLIEDNIDLFLSIPSNSLLYYEKFYSIYMNLNEITLKHLNKLKAMYYSSSMNICFLEEQKYTFEEIETLYEQRKQYILFYNKILDLKVDARLLRVRQLIKKNLLYNIVDEHIIQKLADKIKYMPLYYWYEKEFSNIENITINDVISILINYDEINKYIPEIKNQNELSYVIRNIDTISNCKNLQSIKDNIIHIDKYWTTLKEDLEFNDEFLDKYNDNIKNFLVKDGAELAYSYYKDRNEEQKRAFKLIIKSELMGEFKKLKYHTDDLKKEIDFELKDYQIEEWTKNNINLDIGKYNVGEYDDFYHTMFLGEYPRKTCLSYKDGGYNNCLLACFDSNKKILYATVNGKIVGRAMVRLTKGSYNKVYNNSLSFVDVETGMNEQGKKEDEYLTLFLERPYISGISDKEEIDVKKAFIRLLESKAKKMDALLVLSRDYNNCIDEDFVSTSYYMYISKSKSSSQYLDSLSGQATISDVGQYKSNVFYIQRDESRNMMTA